MRETEYVTTACPECGSQRIMTPQGARRRGTVVIRYHLCRRCGLQFRSRQRLTFFYTRQTTT